MRLDITIPEEKEMARDLSEITAREFDEWVAAMEAALKDEEQHDMVDLGFCILPSGVNYGELTRDNDKVS